MVSETTIEDRRQREIEKYIYLYEKPREKKNGIVAKYGRIAHWRVQLLRSYYREAMNRGARQILDVGCGRADSVKIGQKVGVRTMGVEVVPKLCQTHDVLLIEGAHALPFGAGSFDALSCLDVMEHLLQEDAVPCFKEYARVSPEALIGISLRESAWRAHNLHITIRPAEWWMERLRMVYAEVENYPCGEKEQHYLAVHARGVK